MAPRPLDEIAAVAGRVFMAKGYRASGITDVAKALGLSHGALYTYVRSKEALLYLALLHAFMPDAVTSLGLPVESPSTEQIVSVVVNWSSASANFPTLLSVTARRTRPVAEELGAIIDEFYAFIENNRHMIKLVAACARDVPELAQAWFVRGRRGLLELLGTYLERRIKSGHLRPVPDVPTSARFIVETIAWFAMHRHGDPDSRMLTDDDCRRTVRHLLLAAFLPAG